MGEIVQATEADSIRITHGKGAVLIPARLILLIDKALRMAAAEGVSFEVAAVEDNAGLGSFEACLSNQDGRIFGAGETPWAAVAAMRWIPYPHRRGA